MEYLFFYLLQIFGSFCILGGFLFLLLFILFFVLLYFGIDNRAMFKDRDDDYYKEERIVFNRLKNIFIKLLIVFSILFFIPSKQTLVLFGATYIGKKTIVTSEKLKKIDTIINLELDKRIKELKAGEE